MVKHMQSTRELKNANRDQNTNDISEYLASKHNSTTKNKSIQENTN